MLIKNPLCARIFTGFDFFVETVILGLNKMTSDQTYHKIKKRAKKSGLNQPRTISAKGNRWFLIDRMSGPPKASRLLATLIRKSVIPER